MKTWSNASFQELNYIGVLLISARASSPAYGIMLMVWIRWGSCGSCKISVPCCLVIACRLQISISSSWLLDSLSDVWGLRSEEMLLISNQYFIVRYKTVPIRPSRRGICSIQYFIVLVPCSWFIWVIGYEFVHAWIALTDFSTKY